MNRRDLPVFFKWEERRPLLHEGLLFVPRYYFKHEDWSMPDFSSAAVFGNDREVQIEFCSGNGEWITRVAKENPQINFIAVEWQFKRVRQIWSKKKNHDLRNLLIVCGKAEDFCQYYVKEGSISKIFINFPDPWPKSKHAKNRLLKAPFTERMAMISKEGSKAMIVTDDKVYTGQVIDEMKNSEKWTPSFAEPFYRTAIENYGSSYFNRLWESKGKQIHYIEFIKA